MEYNTSRRKLVLPEYGRNIQMMVNHLLTIEDKEKRSQMAQAIINIMGNMNPHLRDIADFKHKLWDHLAIISDFKLDIDSPYEAPKAEILQTKPEKVEYNISKTRYKHYGKVISQFIEVAVEMDEGEEKEALKMLIANHMKKSYLTWNKDAVSDSLILKDLEELSSGKIKLDPEKVRLRETKEILTKPKKKKLQRKK